MALMITCRCGKSYNTAEKFEEHLAMMAAIGDDKVHGRIDGKRAPKPITRPATSAPTTGVSTAGDVRAVATSAGVADRPVAARPRSRERDFVDVDSDDDVDTKGPNAVRLRAGGVDDDDDNDGVDGGDDDDDARTSSSWLASNSNSVATCRRRAYALPAAQQRHSLA